MGRIICVVCVCMVLLGQKVEGRYESKHDRDRHADHEHLLVVSYQIQAPHRLPVGGGCVYTCVERGWGLGCCNLTKG